MLRAILACCMMVLAAAQPAQAKPLVLGDAYMLPSGAILTYPNNRDYIDPYFATKALLVAQNNGLNINEPARRWIDWLVMHQEVDGLFSRFCFNEDIQQHQACLTADADDVMMAMWLDMLYRMSPASGMQDRWKASAVQALAQLDALYNHQSGVYFVSKALPVGLLMDNIEIYAALSRAGLEAKRIGDRHASNQLYVRAARLKSGIMNTFWDKEKLVFRSSTQHRAEAHFYPDNVAQLLPMLYGFYAHMGGPLDGVYTSWMLAHRESWFGLIGREFPWGLVAVVATQRKDVATAGCWLQQVSPYRARDVWWNVVDEAAFQVVQRRLDMQAAPHLDPCGAMV